LPGDLQPGGRDRVPVAHVGGDAEAAQLVSGSERAGLVPVQDRRLAATVGPRLAALLPILGLQPAALEIVYGCVILAAVMLSSLRTDRSGNTS
jgi:hypothetical protein